MNNKNKPLSWQIYGAPFEQYVYEELPLKEKGFMHFLREHVCGVIGWSSFVVSIILFAIGFSINKKDYESIPVTGTVIAKNEGYASHYKSTKVYSEFYMAVRPIDTKKYRPYEVKTTFLTYSTHSIGSQVTFNMPKANVLIGYERHKLGWIMILAFIFMSVALFLGIDELVRI